jgi:hypothetical protein
MKKIGSTISKMPETREMDVSRCGRIQQVRFVFDVAGNQRRFARVANRGVVAPF